MNCWLHGSAAGGYNELVGCGSAAGGYNELNPTFGENQLIDKLEKDVTKMQGDIDQMKNSLISILKILHKNQKGEKIEAKNLF